MGFLSIRFSTLFSIPAGIALVLSATTLHAAGMPDTGQTICYNDTSTPDIVPASSAVSISRNGGTHPRQDCRYGRDPAAEIGALAKTGAGAKGLDYTKIANNGTVLPASATLGVAPTDWACTRDNITGLIWEVKVAGAANLRYSFNAYSWHDTDFGTNGGNPGSVGTNTCSGTLPAGQCNTLAYVTAVNNAQLCGFTDWRLPSHRELYALTLLDGTLPTIDSDYFPNTLPEPFWTSTTHSHFVPTAWSVNFVGGYENDLKSEAFRVRLVRGASF